MSPVGLANIRISTGYYAQKSPRSLMYTMLKIGTGGGEKCWSNFSRFASFVQLFGPHQCQGIPPTTIF